MPLHEKVAAAKKKMGRARPQMVPEEQPDDDEDFEVPLGDDGRPRGETACLEEADRLREEHQHILRLPEYYRKLGLDESVIDLDKIERAFVKAYKKLQKNKEGKPKHLLEIDYDDLTVAQVCVMEHAKHTWAARGLGKVTRAADLVGKQARVVRAFGGDRVRARERAEREAAEAPAKAEAAASKLLKRHWKAGDVGTTSAGFSEVKAPPPAQKVPSSRSRDQPRHLRLRRARAAAGVRGRARGAPPRRGARARGAEGGGAGGERSFTEVPREPR